MTHSGNSSPVTELDLGTCPRGTIHRGHVQMIVNALGEPVCVPFMVARGRLDGPTVGLTAVVHGNELNGLRIIHRLFADLDPEELRGTVVAIPVVNVPGFLQATREFDDGTDLNRAFPGVSHGRSADVYAHRFLNRVVKKFDYLIDLHTASAGRINSLYVRADLAHPETSWMARAQHPQVVVHNRGGDNTLRGAAMALGVPSITVEVGNPQRFQRALIRFGMIGVGNVLAHLQMLPLEEELPQFEPIVCARSYWLYSDDGGLLDVYPELLDRLDEGQLVARTTDVFGDLVSEYRAPEPGIVVGKSVDPVSSTGARILHLGIVGEPD